MSTTFTSCACDNCGKFIEFDKSQLPYGETRIIECPHCHLETVLVNRVKHPALEKPTTPEKGGTVLLSLGCILMFLIGLAMVIGGCAGDMNETQSAIRQTVFAIQYGVGFLLMVLSMILAALIRLIRNV